MQLPTERAKPSVPHFLDGLHDFERHTLYRPDPVAVKWPLGLGIQKCPAPRRIGWIG
jgi:hypothetical protein